MESTQGAALNMMANYIYFTLAAIKAMVSEKAVNVLPFLRMGRHLSSKKRLFAPSMVLQNIIATRKYGADRNIGGWQSAHKNLT